MNTTRIKNYIFYFVVILLLLVTIGGAFGINYFNNIFFKESKDFLKISSDFNPIDFIWSETMYGDYVEEKDAINIHANIIGVKNKLHFQFDTGDPTTRIRRSFIDASKKMGNRYEELKRGEKNYIKEIDLILGGSELKLEMILVEEDELNYFDQTDTLNYTRIGTIGANFINKYVTEIDFKSDQIKLYKEREPWMSNESSFQSFNFEGRRFMLPCKIDNKEIELFYDSGSSAFGLITTKNRYEKYSLDNSVEKSINVNGHGNSIPVKHKFTNELVEFGNMKLELNRVSYVDMYSNFQGLITPFTRIGGWLGNRPFNNYSLIFDISSNNEEFVIVKK